MGNSPSCVDCTRIVPTGVKLFNSILFCSDGRANGLYKFFSTSTWIKLGDSAYVCPYCLDRRVENERTEEGNRRRREREQRAAEEARQREQQRLETEQRRREAIEEQKRKELDQALNSWIMEEKMSSLEHSHIAKQTKTFNDVTSQSVRMTHIFHETTSEIVSGTVICKDEYDVMRDRSKAARKASSKRNPKFVLSYVGITQKNECLPYEKSVKDIIIEMGHLSQLDAKNINGIMKFVSDHKEDPRFYKLRPALLRDTSRDYSNDKLSICIKELCYAVKLEKDYWPRNTQLLSLYLLMKSSKEDASRLLEIKTGEGKSCIIAMFAVFLALSGRSVDIVTSSPILAIRDAAEWRGFYKRFGIEVDCNLIPKENEDRLKCYKKPVVYGTVGSFASDILRQEFLMEDVRGDRKFDAVIVDEVDSMLLDQGVNFTYLSSPAPGMHHLQPILLMIWNEVIRHPVVRSGLNRSFYVGKPEPMHVVLSKIIGYRNPQHILYLLEHHGVLSKGFMKEVRKDVPVAENQKSFFSKEMTKKKLFECLDVVESNFGLSFEMFTMRDESTIQKVNSKQSHLQLLVVGEGLVCVLYQDKKTLREFIRTEIESFLTSGLQDKEEEFRYEFPSYLSEFVRNRLPQWIDNAFLAMSMKEGREYLIKDQEIVPVDFESTGVVELNTKWGDGLHQFLELKHQKKLSQLSLVTNFMSNQAFFKRYPGKLFGLSGTLGSESELSFLQRYYGLSYSRIPTYLPKQFLENQGLLCSNKVDWLECIGKQVEQHASSAPHHGGKRAVLIICEDINCAKEVKESLTTLKCTSLQLFTENDEEKVVGKKLTGGDVIIATNIAGRGTDIEIEESVVEAGGLFVLVTFLSMNTRVEDQVFGRCARKGQPGSARLVVNKESLPLYMKLESFSDIKKLKVIREENAKRRQNDNEASLFANTVPKEDLFSFYCQYVKGAATELKDESEWERKILLNSMHEFWGLWLKMHCEYLNKDTFEELKQRLNNALQKAKSQVMDKTSPCANLYHIIKFANERLIKKEFEEAERLYTKAIESDETWAAVAYYNRAYCRMLQRKDGYMEAARSDLNEAKKGLCKYKDELMLSISLLSILPKGTKSLDESTTTMSQFQTRGQILNFYEQNIDEALKKLDELEKEKKDAKAIGRNALTIALGDDKFCKKLDSELHVFWDLGLTDIVSIEERRGFNWKAGLVGFLGLVEISVGAFLVVCSTGLLANVGLGFITEGINDIWTSVRAFWTDDHDFVKTWALFKAGSIAISIATYGVGQIKSAVQGAKGITSAFKAAEEQMKTTGKALGEAITELPTNLACGKLKSCTVAMREISKEVAKHTGEKVALKAGKMVVEQAVKEFLPKQESKDILESVNKKLKNIFKKRLEKELDKAMTSEGEFKDSLNKFIIIHAISGKKKEEISDDFMKIHQTLLESTNSIKQLRSLLNGCLKSLLKVAKSEMEDSPGILKNALSSLWDSMSKHCLKRSNEVEHLVSVYCEQLDKALQKAYGSELEDIDEECLQRKGPLIADVKPLIASKIEDHLCQLIQESFECTIDGLVIEKLQNAVDGIISNFSDDNGVGKDILKNIYSISKNSDLNDEEKMAVFAVDTTRGETKSYPSKKSEATRKMFGHREQFGGRTRRANPKKKPDLLIDLTEGGAEVSRYKDEKAAMRMGTWEKFFS